MSQTFFCFSLFVSTLNFLIIGAVDATPSLAVIVILAIGLTKRFLFKQTIFFLYDVGCCQSNKKNTKQTLSKQRKKENKTKP